MEWNNEHLTDTVNVKLWEMGNSQDLSSLKNDLELCRANLTEQATCNDFIADTIC